MTFQQYKHQQQYKGYKIKDELLSDFTDVYSNIFGNRDINYTFRSNDVINDGRDGYIKYLYNIGMTTVTLKSPDGSVETFECDEETYILDALEEAGLEHPYSCKAGACSTCAMKLEEGSVNQEDQSFLEEEQMDDGFVLTCVAYPTSETVTLLAEQEEMLFE